LNEFDSISVGENLLDIYQSDIVKVFTMKDCNWVYNMSDIGVVNLNQYDVSKPLIGTIYELAWYYLCPHKTVFGIFDGHPANDKLAGHPFVQSTVHVWLPNEKEAFNAIVKMYAHPKV